MMLFIKGRAAVNAKRVVPLGLGAAALCAGAALAGDIEKNLRVKPLPDLPKKDENANRLHELLLYLERPDLRERDGVTIDDAYITGALEPAKRVIDGRFDCMDFRMQTLLRLQYSHGDTLRALSPAGARMIEDMFLGAKYWMTEPGEDSMCYWSENHQLLFAVAEYMAGQYWPGRVFANDGATGREHMERARARIEYWARQRFAFGYSEFNSSNYYLYCVGPAANFIQFAAPEDRGLAERVKMCLDLLLFDVACYMHRFSFMAPTGRAYTDNMVGETGDRVRKLTDYLWGLRPDAADNSHSQLINFIAMTRARDAGGKPYYEFPEALRQIGLDAARRELRASYGLDTAELPGRGLVGHGDEQIMRQMSMEAFTNPEVIYNTVTYLDKNGMLTNKFVNYFKIINLKLVKRPRTLRWISEKLNPMPNGVAIQRANLYCYQTPFYALSSLQRYHPGGYGATQMLNIANFGGKAVVFTVHPARHEAENTVSGFPGYWAGYGRAPHSVQHKDILLLLYQLPQRPGFLELYPVPQFTHTYLPEAYFDEVHVSGRYAFARKEGAFLGVIGSRPLRYLPYSEMSARAFKNDMPAGKRFDLVQEGRRHYWIYELSDESREPFGNFMRRVMSNWVAYDGGSLAYESGGRSCETVWGGGLRVDGEEIPLEHRRFENPYCTAERDAPEFLISYGGHSLRLNYEKAEREAT